MADNIIDKMLDMVVRFNSEIIGLPIPGHPQRLQVLRKSWACEALYEEFMEFKNATHMEDEADALIDLTYFALGRLVEMGLAPLPLFESVHAANMAKKRGELSKRPGSMGYDAVKPEGWRAPDLRPYLEVNWQQMYVSHHKAIADASKKEPDVEALNKRAREALQEGRPFSSQEQDKPKGQKDTTGKAPISRIPYEALVKEAEVFQFGSQKYEWDGFKKHPPSVHDLISAIMRHAGYMAEGQDNDYGPNGEFGLTSDPKTNMKWSGLPHWAHIRCCTAMLQWVLANRPDRDDRYVK